MRRHAAEADDRGGESQRLRDDRDELDRDANVESDVDDTDDIEDIDKGGRSNR